jgi:hypothetical protein
MSGTEGFGGAGSTGSGGLARSAPQVYHDAVLASQRTDRMDAAAGAHSGNMPPLTPPPVDPSLGSFASSQGSVRQGPEETVGSRVAAQSAGFPMARVFDGVKPDGGPLINRPKLDPREVPALVAYLTRAAVVLSAPGTTRDELVPGAPPNVPRVFHSDGVWVWPAAVGYYLSLYQLPPQPELLAHVRARQYTLGPVPPQVLQAAAAQIMATLNARSAPPQEHAAHAQRTQQPVMPLPEFSAGFNAAGNRHAAWVTEQLEAFLAYLPLGDWSVDHTTRTYRQSGREFVVDALGTLSPSGVWTWAWADPVSWGQDSAITEQARRLRALGEREGIAEFVTAAFGLVGIADAPESPQDAAEMLAWTAMGMLGARGYIGHSSHEGGDGARVYYVVCDTAVPSAVPRLGTVPRFVMEGATTFGGDASECVLGYVEHFGWEWSRVPGGIVVAAEGLGSFTVEFSPDGQLTGLSLHP